MRSLYRNAMLARASVRLQPQLVTGHLKMAPRPALSDVKQRPYTTESKIVSMPEQYAYTRYRITKPVTSEGAQPTEYEDVNLVRPDRDNLAKMTKENTLFLRFLKLVTEKEDRQQAFIEFTKRSQDGLVVEKDVYLTLNELQGVMWKNGYSLQEIEAYYRSFPPGYKFHYPEIAVLFELTEEDCYAYCLRTRASSNDLIEIRSPPPKGLSEAATTYGLMTTAVWSWGNNVLGNVWFLTKTWPFLAVFWNLARRQQRGIQAHFHGIKHADASVAEENRRAGEEAIAQQLHKYENDTKCLEALLNFEEAVKSQMANYRASWIAEQQKQLAEKTFAHLYSIRQTEASIARSLQQTIISETGAKFREEFAANSAMQDKALAFAVSALEGDTKSTLKDTVVQFFDSSFGSITTTDMDKVRPDPNGSIAERVAAVSKAKETEFLNAYSISPQEASQVKEFVARHKKDNRFEVSNLSADELRHLESLFTQLNKKVGFYTFNEGTLRPISSQGVTDVEALRLIEAVNEKIATTSKAIRDRRLSAFGEAFCS